MSEELVPTNRQEKIMSDTIRALNGDDVTDALVPGWDDEYFLDNILKAAQGEDPQYNLEPRWHHQKFYKAIAEAIAESGGGSNWEKLATKEFTVSTTSTSATLVGTIDLSSSDFSAEFIIWVHVRDKAGKRNGHYYGGDHFTLVNKNVPTNANYEGYSIRYTDDAFWKQGVAAGVYPYAISPETKSLTMNSKYSATNTLTINGTYKVDVYKLTLPEGMTLFE